MGCSGLGAGFFFLIGRGSDRMVRNLVVMMSMVVGYGGCDGGFQDRCMRN